MRITHTAYRTVDTELEFRLRTTRKDGFRRQPVFHMEIKETPSDIKAWFFVANKGPCRTISSLRIKLKILIRELGRKNTPYAELAERMIHEMIITINRRGLRLFLDDHPRADDIRRVDVLMKKTPLLYEELRQARTNIIEGREGCSLEELFNG